MFRWASFRLIRASSMCASLSSLPVVGLWCTWVEVELLHYFLPNIYYAVLTYPLGFDELLWKCVNHQYYCSIFIIKYTAVNRKSCFKFSPSYPFPLHIVHVLNWIMFMFKIQRYVESSLKYFSTVHTDSNRPLRTM